MLRQEIGGYKQGLEVLERAEGTRPDGPQTRTIERPANGTVEMDIGGKRRGTETRGGANREVTGAEVRVL